MVVLSQKEEEKLLSDYSRIAWKLVHRFADGKGSSVFSKEDLYQECMLALVKHMRKCETKEQLRCIHPMNMINAMARFVLKGQAVRLDCNRTDQIKAILKSVKTNVPISEAMNLYDNTTEDDWIAKIDYDRFTDSILPEHKEVLRQIGLGYPQWEVGKNLGKTQQWCQWVKNSTRVKYNAYMAS